MRSTTTLLAAPPQPSQATQLVALAAGAELFHSPDGQAFARVAAGDHRENWPIKSRTFRRYLARRFYETTGAVSGAPAIHDALGVLEGKALYDGEEVAVFIRVAEHEGAIYLDLANELWQAVRVTPTDWQVIDNPPVRFRRSRGMLPLPAPQRGGCLGELRPFVNVRDETDWCLIVGWLLAAFRPRGPYPPLAVHGEQGAAKSTLCRVLRDLIDPNTAPLRSEPREARDLMIAARNGWIITLDNLSHLRPWLSDAICRLATGGGFTTRELYTDDEEVLFDAQRPVMLTAIDDVATRGDLIDRAIITHLPRIPDHQRRSEADFWAAFEAARPRVLGALLDAVSCALHNLPTVSLARLPRMADLARWVTAAEPGLGWKAGAFLRAYGANRAAANALALEASPVAAVVRAFMSLNREWAGTATELLKELSLKAHETVRRQRSWPKNARSLSSALRRLAANLREVGLQIEFGQRPGSDSTRYIEITRLAVSASPASPATQPGGSRDGSDARDAGDANIEGSEGKCT